MVCGVDDSILPFCPTCLPECDELLTGDSGCDILQKLLAAFIESFLARTVCENIDCIDGQLLTVNCLGGHFLTMYEELPLKNCTA